MIIMNQTFALYLTLVLSFIAFGFIQADRASVVGDAINYIKELMRTVNELKLLVEKKVAAGDGENFKKVMFREAADHLVGLPYKGPKKNEDLCKNK